MAKPSIKELKQIKVNSKIKSIQTNDKTLIDIFILENDLDHKQLEISNWSKMTDIVNYEDIKDIIYE